MNDFEKQWTQLSRQTRQLNRLVRGAQDVAQLREQGGILPEQMTCFSLSQCALQVLRTYRLDMIKKIQTLDFLIPEQPVYTHAHEDYITQVLHHLVDDANTFCPQRGQLLFSIAVDGSLLRLTIRSDAPAPDPASYAQLQSDDPRGEAFYIAKTLICAHGQEFSVTGDQTQTTVVFTLPLVTQTL